MMVTGLKDEAFLVIPRARHWWYWTRTCGCWTELNSSEELWPCYHMVTYNVSHCWMLNIQWWEESFSKNKSSHHQSSVHRLLQGKVEEIFYLNQIIHCKSGEGGKMNQLIRNSGYRVYRDCHGYDKPTGECCRLAWGWGTGWTYPTQHKPVPPPWVRWIMMAILLGNKHIGVLVN